MCGRFASLDTSATAKGGSYEEDGEEQEHEDRDPVDGSMSRWPCH